MPDPNQTQDTKPDTNKDTSRTSGATRRIVVEDVAREQMPKAIGRRLDTPSEPYTHEPPMGSRPVYANVSTVSGNKKRTIMIAGGVVLVLIIVPAFAFLFHTARNRKAAKAATSATPEPVAVATATPEPTVEAPEESPTIETPLSVEAAEIRLMTLQLASQISQKSGYEFGPEFVELVSKRTPDYIAEKPLIAARQYRHEINKSFRDEGLNPLIGYVLAMSRSKFDPLVAEKGIGIWQLPMSVARSQGYLDAENSSKLKVPGTSAQIVASYTRQLLSTFESDDFMYAIACFGMSLQEAGKLQARLVTTAPNTKSRRDIMKMIKAGVLTDDQVENIARFFAAGIVGENPQHFGLTAPQPFSSLY